MLIVISPAKTLDFTKPSPTREFTNPVFLKEAGMLVKKLRGYSVNELKQLMGISGSLAQLNFNRYQSWNFSPTIADAKQAVMVFNGDVYAGLEAWSLTEGLLLKSQERLRILSGLYGVLKPLDLIQPYRLEMATDSSMGKYRGMYDFWGKKILGEILKALRASGSHFLVNLASDEYFKSIAIKEPGVEIIKPEFKEFNAGNYRMVSFYAKKARGMMTRFILENSITQPEEIKAFNAEGYIFNPHLSYGKKLVFTRGD